MASQAMPSKQIICVAMISLFDLLVDLVLSFIGYSALVYALYVLIGMTANWTIHPGTMNLNWRDEVMKWMLFSLWGTRFVLRGRRHFACTRGYLICILRWLSPLYPKPYEACPCCPTAMHRELASGKSQQDDEYVELRPNQQDDEYMELRSIGIFL